jgi:hypothetical protein
MKKFEKGQVVFIDRLDGDGICSKCYYWGKDKHEADVVVHNKEDAFSEYYSSVNCLKIRSYKKIHTKPQEHMKKIYNFHTKRVRYFNFYIREVLYEKIS